MKLLPLALLLVPSIAAASPAPAPTAPVSVQAPAPSQGRDSLNANVFGLLGGDFYLTYEHLFGSSNGLILEAGGGSSTDNGATDTRGAVAIGYRWHWSHKQNSGFLGVTLAQAYGSGSVTETDTVNGQTTSMTYGMRTTSTMLTGNIGKRWMIGDKWNITLRFGLGWGHHTATAKDNTPEAKSAENTMNALLAFLPIGAEGELSVGYVF